MPILSLRLNLTGLGPSECHIISSYGELQHLRDLDLSFNPIRIDGLVSLIDPQYSCLRKLKRLSLVDCSINAKQASLISVSKLEELRAQVALNYLNVSHN